jgi:hypothetical protein
MIELINQAQIFRFLNKPVNQQLVRSHLLAALERAQLLRESPELVKMYKPAPAMTALSSPDAGLPPPRPAMAMAEES